MAQNTVYANWWSRVLFARNFERQFFIPIPPTAVEYHLLKLIERTKFSGDLSHVKIDRPVFIVGLPRSGTTLLYNLLCAHEKAAFVTNSINAFTEAIRSIEWLRKKLNLNIRGERFLQDSIDTDFGSPSEPIMFWGKWIGRDVESLYWPEKRIADLPPGKVEEIHTDVRKILTSFGGDDRRFICKYPVFQTELRLLQDLFPDARFIHIIRDGRETANSLVKLYHLTNDQIRRIKHPWVKHVVPYPRVKNLEKYVKEFGPDSLETTARVWRDSIDLVEQTRPDLRHFTQIRYEDLLKNPRAELQRIFDFAELSWPETETFRREFEGIGVVRHKNRYSGFDIVEQAVPETLKKFGYL